MERVIRYWSYRVLTPLILAFMAGCGSDASTPATTIPGPSSLYYGHSAAFRNNSTMTWGYNAFGQLGNNTTTNSAVPVSVLTLTDATPATVIPLTGITAVSTGGDHTLALKNDGTVFGWGHNVSGQTGNNLVENGDPVARQVQDPLAGPNAPFNQVQKISAGGDHSLALRLDETVWAWGANDSFQLGNGRTASLIPNPVRVSGLTNVTAIAAGGSHSLALDNTGAVWAWGANNRGQLGDGSLIGSSVPLQAKDASGVALSGIKAIAAGGAFSVAIDGNDNVLVWGYNGFGQLGPNPTTNSFGALFNKIDKSVFTTTGTVVAIAAGFNHVLALTSDGTIWAWGYNFYGQLGVAPATTTSGFSFTPTAIIPNAIFDTTARIDGVSPILAIGHHNLARRTSDGKLVAWGQNTNGQLGDGTTTDSILPVVVTGF